MQRVRDCSTVRVGVRGRADGAWEVEVSSRFGPDHAPAGDVGTALMVIDSRLARLRSDAARAEAEQEELLSQFFGSFDAESANAVIDGTCTLIYLYMRWLREADEAQDGDVLEHVLPYVVGTMQMMKRSVRPETIPTMAAMMTAAVIGLSPTLWREQYGPWREAEPKSLEVTAFLLAEHINYLTKSDDTATRIISDMLEAVGA